MRHVLPAAALLSLGCSLPAVAETMVQPAHAVYGCVDPRASTALAIPDGRLRNRKWVEYVHRTGHCALLPAGQPLTVLAHQGPLSLVKSPSADADTPPVYTQSSDLTQAATQPAPDTAAQTPTAAPATTDAVPPAAVPPTAVSPAGVSPTGPQTAGPTIPADVATAVPGASTPTAPVVAAPPTDAADGTALPAAAPANGTATNAPTTPPADAAQSGPASGSASGPSSQPTTAAAPASTPPVATPPVAEPVAPVAATPAPVPAPVPAAPAAVTPVNPSTPTPSHSSGVTLLLVLVVLALLGLVGAAVAIARQQRRFAHVEDANWPPRDETADPLSQPRPVTPAAHAEPSPQAFRKGCVDILERGGWTIQPSFAASATREGAPDILGRRRDAVLAVRCRGGDATITPEMIDEVAAMGQAAHAHVTVLATAAPMTRRAHDEAMRLHVHVLAQDELGSLSA